MRRSIRFEHGRGRSGAQQRDDQGARGRYSGPRRGRPEPPPTSTSSTAAVKAEGWGTLKGQFVFGGDPPPASDPSGKGKAEKDPEICAKDGPIKSERLVVDPASKGVRFALVYLPKPTAVNEDAKKAAASAKIEFDQKGCVFEPHVLGLMAGVPVTLKSSDPTNHNVNVKLKNSSFNQTSSAAEQPFRSHPRPPSGRPARSFATFIPG